MAISKKQKTQVIEELKEKISSSKAIVFTDYQGLSVEAISQVRNDLREKGIEFKVLKNTLFKIAAKEAGVDIDFTSIKNHPVAAAFGYDDEVEPSKIVYAFTKKNDSLEIVGGVLNGKTLTLDEVKSLALMPSREEMYAKIVGSIANPLRGMVNVLSGNLRGLVTVLSEIQKVK